jgi:cytochrome c553
LKKILIVGAALVLFAVSWGVIFLVGLPHAAAPSDEAIATTGEQVERGDYLFNNVLGCPVCHSKRNYDLFGGPPVPPFGGGRPCVAAGEKPPGLAEEGGMPGILCFRNITADKVTGIGDWTDGEILRALREGISKDGHGLFPMMPYFIYRNLSDDDARAVVAYLRTLPPVTNDLPSTELEFPFSLFAKLMPAPLESPVAHPDSADPAAYGAYLATVARCAFCHTPRDRGRQAIPGKDFVGGVEFQGREGFLYSTNLTVHPDGLADMALDEFIALFRRPATPTEGEVNVMPWTYFSGMTDADLGALYAFFQTVPAQPLPSGKP